jgi:hypothetical protein
VLIQLAAGLEALHAARVVHRDIKNENLFTCTDGTIKIGDFGLGRLLSDETDETRLARSAVGTPLYFSPERCQGRPYDHKSDIWALGCVVHELATLRPPFVASSEQALARRILHALPPPLPPGYSMQLAFLAAKLLEKDPAARPTASQILQYEPVRQRWPEVEALMGMAAPLQPPLYPSHGALRRPAPPHAQGDSPAESMAVPSAHTPEEPPPLPRSSLPHMHEPHPLPARPQQPTPQPRHKDQAWPLQPTPHPRHDDQARPLQLDTAAPQQQGGEDSLVARRHARRKSWMPHEQEQRCALAEEPEQLSLAAAPRGRQPAQREVGAAEAPPPRAEDKEAGVTVRCRLPGRECSGAPAGPARSTSGEGRECLGLSASTAVSADGSGCAPFRDPACHRDLLAARHAAVPPGYPCVPAGLVTEAVRDSQRDSYPTQSLKRACEIASDAPGAPDQPRPRPPPPTPLRPTASLFHASTCSRDSRHTAPASVDPRLPTSCACDAAAAATTLSGAPLSASGDPAAMDLPSLACPSLTAWAAAWPSASRSSPTIPAGRRSSPPMPTRQSAPAAWTANGGGSSGGGWGGGSGLDDGSGWGVGGGSARGTIRAEMQREIQSLRDEISRHRAEGVGLRRHCAIHKSKAAALARELAAARSELGTARSEQDATRSELGAARSELATARSELSAVKLELGAARRAAPGKAEEICALRAEKQQLLLQLQAQASSQAILVSQVCRADHIVPLLFSHCERLEAAAVNAMARCEELDAAIGDGSDLEQSDPIAFRAVGAEAAIRTGPVWELPSPPLMACAALFASVATCCSPRQGVSPATASGDASPPGLRTLPPTPQATPPASPLAALVGQPCARVVSAVARAAAAASPRGTSLLPLSGSAALHSPIRHALPSLSPSRPHAARRRHGRVSSEATDERAKPVYCSVGSSVHGSVNWSADNGSSPNHYTMLTLPVDSCRACHDALPARAPAAGAFGSALPASFCGTTPAHTSGAVSHTPSGSATGASSGAIMVSAGQGGSGVGQRASPWAGSPCPLNPTGATPLPTPGCGTFRLPPTLAGAPVARDNAGDGATGASLDRAGCGHPGTPDSIGQQPDPPASPVASIFASVSNPRHAAALPLSASPSTPSHARVPSTSLTGSASLLPAFAFSSPGASSSAAASASSSPRRRISPSALARRQRGSAGQRTLRSLRRSSHRQDPHSRSSLSSRSASSTAPPTPTRSLRSDETTHPALPQLACSALQLPSADVAAVPSTLGVLYAWRREGLVLPSSVRASAGPLAALPWLHSGAAWLNRQRATCVQGSPALCLLLRMRPRQQRPPAATPVPAAVLRGLRLRFRREETLRPLRVPAALALPRADAPGGSCQEDNDALGARSLCSAGKQNGWADRCQWVLVDIPPSLTRLREVVEIGLEFDEPHLVEEVFAVRHAPSLVRRAVLHARGEARRGTAGEGLAGTTFADTPERVGPMTRATLASQSAPIGAYTPIPAAPRHRTCAAEPLSAPPAAFLPELLYPGGDGQEGKTTNLLTSPSNASVSMPQSPPPHQASHPTLAHSSRLVSPRATAAIRNAASGRGGAAGAELVGLFLEQAEGGVIPEKASTATHLMVARANPGEDLSPAAHGCVHVTVELGHGAASAVPMHTCLAASSQRGAAKAAASVAGDRSLGVAADTPRAAAGARDALATLRTHMLSKTCSRHGVASNPAELQAAYRRACGATSASAAGGAVGRPVLGAAAHDADLAADATPAPLATGAPTSHSCGADPVCNTLPLPSPGRHSSDALVDGHRMDGNYPPPPLDHLAATLCGPSPAQGSTLSASDGCGAAASADASGCGRLAAAPGDDRSPATAAMPPSVVRRLDFDEAKDGQTGAPGHVTHAAYQDGGHTLPNSPLGGRAPAPGLRPLMYNLVDVAAETAPTAVQAATGMLHPRELPPGCAPTQDQAALGHDVIGASSKPAGAAALVATSRSSAHAPSAAEEEERQAIVAELRRLRALAKETELARVSAAA